MRRSAGQRTCVLLSNTARCVCVRAGEGTQGPLHAWLIHTREPSQMRPNKRWSTTTEYVLSEAYRVIFAVNPKVMSTSAKQLVYALDNNGSLAGYEERGPKYLGDFGPADVAALLRDSRRVLFIRNPYRRLYRCAWGEAFKLCTCSCILCSFSVERGVCLSVSESV